MFMLEWYVHEYTYSIYADVLFLFTSVPSVSLYAQPASVDVVQYKLSNAIPLHITFVR